MLVAIGVSASGCGGSGGGASGTGGSTSGATGGAGGAATTGSGGARTTGGGGASGGNPMTLPLCLAAPDPNAQVRDADCTVGNAAKPDCMVRCGPSIDANTRGYRPLNCGPDANSPSGVGFVQGTCYFDPAQNYSCFKLPSPTVACPAGTKSGGACTAAACAPCGDGVDVTKGYVDSSGAPKAGFCLCSTNATTGAQTWTCGSNKEYPCYPASPGASVSPGCT
jgi:hypothetical protein